jgi:hypothetical protein
MKQVETAGSIRPLPTCAIWLYGLLGAAATLLIGGRCIQRVLHGELVNPDSYMRLVRIEAMLPMRRGVDIVARDGSGAGTLLHWSHLLDSLIVALASPLSLALGPHDALRWAAAAAGPLSMGALGAAIAWAAAPFANRRWLWLGPVLAAVSPAIASYGLPGEAHHHVLLVLVATVIAGWNARMLTGRVPTTAGWSLGAWAGLGIWLSPEAMPFVLMGFLALWLGWVMQPQRTYLADGVANTGLAFLLVTGAAFAVDPSPAGYGAVEIDRLSIIYVVLAVLCCGVGLSAVAIERLRLMGAARPALAIAIASACGAVWFSLYPAVLRGPAGLMDGGSAAAFFGGIDEMQPVRSLGEAVQYLLGGAVAASALGWFAWRGRSWLMLYVTGCAIVLLLLGATHERFAAYAAAAASLLLPVMVTRIEQAQTTWPPVLPAAARLGVVALCLLATRADGLTSTASARETDTADCSVSHLARMLRPFAGQVVLADANDTPELLYRTGILTAGSLYHRNVAGFLRLRAAWRSLPSPTEPAAVRATGAVAVLACRHKARSALVADLPPDTLLDRLARGETPPWLTEVAADPASGNVLYRMAR